MEGNRLDVWAQQFFSIGFQYGLVHALVDFPKIDREAVKTKADEKAAGSRPYATMLNPRQVIGWKSKVVKGKVVLTDLRIREVIIIDGDDYGKRKLSKYAISCRARLKFIAEIKVITAKAMADSRRVGNSRDDIPLVTLYTKRTGFMRVHRHCLISPY